MVRSDFYRWIGHPLHTVGVLFFVAVGLMTVNRFVLLFAVVAAVRLFIVPLEKKKLADRFGCEYERPRRRTRAMIPRIGRDDG